MFLYVSKDKTPNKVAFNFFIAGSSSKLQTLEVIQKNFTGAMTVKNKDGGVGKESFFAVLFTENKDEIPCKLIKF